MISNLNCNFRTILRVVKPKKLKYIEAYCPGGSQFLRNCTLLQCLPVQGFISKILSRGEGIVTQRG